jgi:hypothetical protein
MQRNARSGLTTASQVLPGRAAFADPSGDVTQFHPLSTLDRPRTRDRRPAPARPGRNPRVPEPTSEPRAKRGRRAASPRLQFSRLFTLVVISLIAGAIVAAVSWRMMPTESDDGLTDPAFDVAAFYQSHQTTGITGTTYVTGQPLAIQPKPTAGLNQAQMNNAYIIVEVGRTMNLPKRAYVVAIATAMQETNLRNLANARVPASLKLPHEGAESNFDSLGLFQQRPSQGWGSTAQLMDPADSSSRFYAKLMRISGWQNMSIGGAAQAVQRSAFPTAYAKHATDAQHVVDAMPAS